MENALKPPVTLLALQCKHASLNRLRPQEKLHTNAIAASRVDPNVVDNKEQPLAVHCRAL